MKSEKKNNKLRIPSLPYLPFTLIPKVNCTHSLPYPVHAQLTNKLPSTIPNNISFTTCTRHNSVHNDIPNIVKQEFVRNKEWSLSE